MQGESSSIRLGIARANLLAFKSHIVKFQAMTTASLLPTVSLPLTALYSGAVGILFALLSLRAFLYRGSKGSKAYFGDQNIPSAPKLQSVVRVSDETALSDLVLST